MFPRLMRMYMRGLRQYAILGCLLALLLGGARPDHPGLPRPLAISLVSGVRHHHRSSPAPANVSGLRAITEQARGFVDDLPWWAQISLLAKVVLVAPTIGAMIAAALAVGGDVEFSVAIVGAGIGLIYQTLLLLILGKLLGKRLYSIPVFGKRLARASTLDWSRRMASRPALEGWVTMFIARSRTTSMLGAVLCQPGAASLARFVGLRFPAIFVWATVSFFVAFAGLRGLAAAAPHVGRVRLTLAVLLLAVLVRTAPMLLVRRGRQWVLGW